MDLTSVTLSNTAHEILVSFDFSSDFEGVHLVLLLETGFSSGTYGCRYPVDSHIPSGDYLVGILAGDASNISFTGTTITFTVAGFDTMVRSFVDSAGDVPDPAEPGAADWDPLYADINIQKVDIYIDAFDGGIYGGLPGRPERFRRVGRLGLRLGDGRLVQGRSGLDRRGYASCLGSGDAEVGPGHYGGHDRP